MYEFMDEVRERISEDDISGINRWNGAAETLHKLKEIMPQYLGRDSFTAYYYFPDGFSNDSLWRIRRQSDEYAIAAPAAAISDGFMSENNIHFYKIGRDIHGSFADFDSRKMFDVLSDKHLLETAKALSKAAGKPFTEFAYDEADNKTEEEFDRMKELYAADIFRIYQVKSGEDYHYKRFAHFDELREDEYPNIADYDLVYTGNLSDYYGVNDTPGEFDSIFAAFNLNRPDDFTGRSMSTSDVLVLHGDTPYYADSIGYKMLNKDFLISRDNEKETIGKNEPALSDINVVTPEKIGEVIETREPRDIFLAQDGDRWVGVDNRTGDAWTEDLGTKDEAVRWLNGEEIDEISKTDKAEILSEKETAEPYEPKLGDKFIDKHGEEWELTSLTGVLPWYTDQCAIRSISGGFSVEKNETYANLLDPAKYTRPVDVSEKEIEEDKRNTIKAAVISGDIAELREHLEMNGYYAEWDGNTFLADAEEIDYIKTVMDDRNITYIIGNDTPEYTPKIGDMIDINDSLLTVADISGNLITFTDSETLFAEQSRMTFADFYAQDFSVVSEAAEPDEPAEDISGISPNADVPVEHPEKSAEEKPPQKSDGTLYTYDENDPDKSKILLHSVTFDLTSKPKQKRQPEKQPDELGSEFWNSKDHLVDSERGQNYVITDENLGAAAPKARYRANIEAIKTLKAIEHNNLSLAADMFRPQAASPEQQEILSRYTGWGAIPQVFDSSNKDWTNEYEELKEILTEEEYSAARRSTMNAHYTSPTVINAIYRGLAKIGFEKGDILEPAMGIGNFFGAMPESMRGSELHGAELDSITGRIARQLYPKADIQVKGFEQTKFKNDSFDVIVGNVPFGNYKIDDKDYNKHKFLIHDYFIAKSIDKVRPGGIVAVVTSKGTMDKENSDMRKYIAQRAELLGAVRLPNNAFKANAGTEVTSDILFFQKRERPIEIDPAEVEWLSRAETENGLLVNNYFVQHPEMVLGKIVEGNKMYGTQQGNTSCEPIPGKDLKEQLAEAVGNIRGTYTAAEKKPKSKEIEDVIPAPPDSRIFSYYAVDGAVYFRDDTEDMTRVNLKGESLKKAIAMIEIRENVRELLDLQLNNADHSLDGDIALSRSDLNARYDAFAAKYGHFDDKKNTRILKGDDGYNLLTALEEKDKEGNYTKAAVFSHDTVKPNMLVTHVDTAEEALILSVAEKAKVDFDYMTELCGHGKDELIRELEGQIFRLPQQEEEYVTADEYLTGNIRTKLRELNYAPEGMDVSKHREALEAAMPKKIEAKDITVKLGSHWVAPKYVEQFIKAKFNPGWRSNIEVHYSKASGRWKIEGMAKSDKTGYTSTHDFGTRRKNAYDILEGILNHEDLTVKDIKLDEQGNEMRDSKGNYIKVTNREETKAVQTCVRRIENEWLDWIFKDPDRRADLVERYNEIFNSIRHREYDGSHLSFIGMNTDITLKEHQKNAVARALYGGNTLLAHAVGGGKTFEMITVAMEGKRLGLHSKSLFAVPNSLTEQFGRDFRKLYPAANILVATKKDFEPKNRKQLFARIATGEWDAVIVGHSQFDRMGISPDRLKGYMEAEIASLRTELEAAQSIDGKKSFSVKEIERTIAKYEKKLKDNDKIAKDSYIDFEQMGFDKLFVDECHMYKNLGTATKMSNVAGITVTGSAKAAEFLMKTRYFDEITGGKGIVAASGTPISNSMTELYTMMRYLQSDLLRECGIDHFDEWAADFGNVVTDYELKPESDGKYQLKTRFAQFTNLPELMGMFKECADIRTADTLDIEKPETKVHDIVAEPSKIQKRLIKSLSKRATKIRDGFVDPKEDNMLVITNDGRKIGLDQRLMIPGCPDEPKSKVNLCINNVFDIWEKTSEKRSTQLIFCDMSTPKQADRQDRFEIYRPKEEGEFECIRRKIGLGKSGTKKAAETFDDVKAYVDKAAADSPEDKLQTGDIAVFRVPAEDGKTIESRAAVFMGGKFVEEDSPGLLEKLYISPVEDMPPKTFNVYDDIKDKLIAKGIPEKEIAFIHDYDTAEKKQGLFGQMNRGEVRVLLGSTAKCGAGMNVQEKLIALHHLDCPLRPSDMQQRDGRIARQGNENPVVDIFRYVTDKSFDAYLYQILENKQKFISQVMTSKTPERVCSDVDEQALDYAEVKSLCAGNPLIKREMELQTLIRDIKSEKNRYNENLYELQDNIRVKYPNEIRQNELYAKHYADDLKKANESEKISDKDGNEMYPLKLGDTVYTCLSEAGDALKNAVVVNMAKMAEGKEVRIGEYRGMELSVMYNDFSKKYQACLKGEKHHYCDIVPNYTAANIRKLDDAIACIQTTAYNLTAKAEQKKSELEQMKADVEKPFAREGELRAALEELEEVHIKLTEFELTDDTAQKDIFERLAEMFPDIMTGDVTYRKYRTDCDAFMPLAVEMQEDILIMEQNYVQNGDLMCDPRIDFRIDYENKRAIPVSYENSGLGKYERFDVDNPTPEVMKQVNDVLSFADNWFDNIEAQGYKPVQGDDEPDLGRDDVSI
ncbi:MAG: YodL domain-containing protein [Ruminococcus sp.]|nr:YodL domain-containing protein [Ruminococcus sp.]